MTAFETWRKQRHILCVSHTRVRVCVCWVLLELSESAERGCWLSKGFIVNTSVVSSPATFKGRREMFAIELIFVNL